MRRSSLTNPAYFLAGGRYAATTAAECNANFPALKHFFPCEETSDNTITDRAGGVTATGSGAITNSNGILTITSTGPTAIAGSWAIPGTKKVLVLFAGKPAVSASPLLCMGEIAAAGTTTNGFIRLSSSNAAPSASRVGVVGIAALNAGVTSLLVGDSTLAGYALAIDWAATSSDSMVQYDFDETTASARNNIDVGTTMSAGLGAFTAHSSAQLIAIGANPGNIQVWHFTTLPKPAEIKAALAWMTYHKGIAPYSSLVYPGFKDRA